MFLFAVMDLIKDGKKESAIYVEEHISTGIASSLFKKYKNEFIQAGFSIDHVESIDNYYKEQYNGVADSLEHKYRCEKEDGLYLIIKIALNEIF